MVNIELTPKLIFTIGIIMIATYTCSAIIFPDDATDYMNTYNRYDGVAGEVSFSVWIDMNFDLAYQHIFDGLEISNRRVFSSVTYWYIFENYKESSSGWLAPERGMFDTYVAGTEGAGWRWFNGDWVQGAGIWELIEGVTRAENIDDEYHIYLQNIGVEDKPKGNLIDTISDFLTNIWEGFTQLLRLLTFTNIPNMPLWVLGLLNIFFIPMWIVLIVGIAPYVMEIIKTISSFIEAWKPW